MMRGIENLIKAEQERTEPNLNYIFDALHENGETIEQFDINGYMELWQICADKLGY